MLETPCRLQVLAALTFFAGLPLAFAQPPDTPLGIAGEQGLLPLSVDEWLQQSGGLTRLTLKMEDATVEEVAAEVSRQTGLRVVAGQQLVVLTRGQAEPDEANRPRFSVEASGQPLFQAVREWSRSANSLRLERSLGRTGVWQLVPTRIVPPGAPASAQAAPRRQIELGPCTLRPISAYVQRSREVRLDDGPIATPPRRNDLLQVRCGVELDPRLTASVGGVLAESVSAETDQGMLAPQPSFSSSMRGMLTDFEFSLSTEAPRPEATKLRSLKGLLRLAVATRVEVWEIPLAARPEETAPAEKTFKVEGGEVTLRLDRISVQGGDREAPFWEVRVMRTRAPVGPQRHFKPKRGPDMMGPELGYQSLPWIIEVVDSEGQPFSSGGYGMRGGPTATLDLSIGAGRRPGDNAGPPAKVIVRMPLEWREVQMPFEFKDLPLP